MFWAPVNSEIIFGKIDQAMRLRHLIEDAHPLAPLWRINGREFGTADCILKNESGP